MLADGKTLGLRRSVFWPSYVAFFLIGGFSFLWGAPFIGLLENLKNTMFEKLDWLFAYGTFGMVIICVLIYVSPLTKVKIGGESAIPLFNKKQWFAISLCTTVVAGIMFWATSEPLIHLSSPPKSMGLDPNSLTAERFALATLFHHWSITPYAIYTLPAMAFALAFYNLKQPFSLSSIFSPILGSSTQKYSCVIDGICVFALVSGFAASLGTGALTILGAFESHFSKDLEPLLLGVLIALLVLCFTASAVSGLMKGIRLLSNINMLLFFVIIGIIFFLGPSKDILLSIVNSIGYYLKNFFSMSTFTTSGTGDPWPNQWPIFYWSSWLSWAPITAVFLGRISYGHRIRDFIHINLIAPSIFSCIWAGVFGGSALYFQRLDGSLYKALQDFGPNVVSYELLQRLPFASMLIILFVLVTFLSYTSGADSTTEALAALCTRQKSDDTMAKSSNRIKIIWALTIGFVSWILVAHSGIEGMKLLCCVGGLPALLLVMGATASLIKMSLVDLKNGSEKKVLSEPLSPKPLGLGERGEKVAAPRACISKGDN